MSADKKIRSFIEVSRDSHFPIQNLPYGIFINKKKITPRAATIIGDTIIDLSVLEDHGFFSDVFYEERNIFSEPHLNKFMSLERSTHHGVRTILQRILSEEDDTIKGNSVLRDECLIPKSDAEMLMPVAIGNYTDFYSSKEHATNVGIMFRGKDKALMPNWLHLPVAYHGRASSVVVSGTDIIRPKGQTSATDEGPPSFGPCKLLDFELETGFFIGKGNKLGDPIPVEDAFTHIFGMVLVNDWSARDIQKWEYVPLGPFLAKNFATSISPWIVTMEALEPFKTRRVKQDPESLPYLRSNGDMMFDINLEVRLRSEKMSEAKVISRSNFKNLYWDMSQQLAHHTITGCNMRTGDLLASGTISGKEKDSYGSMLELTWRGSEPLKISDSEERKFLQDGDTLTISGWCEGDGYKVGFGEVTGKILPAK